MLSNCTFVSEEHILMCGYLMGFFFGVWIQLFFKNTVLSKNQARNSFNPILRETCCVKNGDWKIRSYGANGKLRGILSLPCEDTDDDMKSLLLSL